MPGNRGVAYLGPGRVEVQSIDYPKLQNPQGKKIDHGVILKIVSTNICGSDQHMVRGRTTAPAGLVLGHEITGEIIEKGSVVEFLAVGDLVTVPFNIACGRCRNRREGKTGSCVTGGLVGIHATKFSGHDGSCRADIGSRPRDETAKDGLT